METIQPRPASESRAYFLLRAIVYASALGLVYLIIARSSELLVRSPQGLATIWPASGFALASLLLNRRRSWWWLLPVFLAADTIAGLLAPRPLVISLGFALNNLAETLLIATLLSIFSETTLTLTSIGQVMRFFFLVMLGNALTGLSGALLASWSWGVGVNGEWLAWWFSHGLGITLIAPPIMAFRSNPPRRADLKIESVLLFASLLIACAYLFVLPQPAGFSSVLRTYLVFPFLMWAALRFSPHFATSLLAITGLIAVIGTTFNSGIFSSLQTNLDDRIFTVQLYVGVMSFSTLMVIANLAERKRAAELLLEKEQRLLSVFENSPDTIFTLTLPVFYINFLNHQNFIGYTTQELSQPDALADVIHPEDLAQVGEYWRQVGAGSSPGRIEYRMRRKGGDYEWIQMRTSVLSRSQDGSAFQVQATLTEINDRKQAERIGRTRLRLVEFAISHSLEELLQATLDEAETLTGSRISFYHLLEAGQSGVALQTWSTRTIERYCQIRESLDAHYPLDQAGVWYDCVRERRPIIHNDYASLPNRGGTPPGHVELIREMTVPVLRGDKVVCVVAVGNKPVDYTRSDLEIIAQLGDLTWEITERKLTERALQRNAELLKETQALTGMGGWQYDLANKKMTWTSEVYKIYGVDESFDPSDINRAISWYAPEDQQIIDNAFHRAISAGQPYELELGFINARGRHMWVRTSGRPVREGGRIVKVTGTIADVTERKLVENALAHSEEQLRLAMDATSDGLWDWRCAENFTYYSPGYYRMLGYEPHEFPSEPQEWINLVHPEERDLVTQVDADILENRIESFEIEMRLRAKNGDWKWILSRGKMVGLGQDGRALRVVGTHVDITERKRIEEALRRANRKLENQASANLALQQLLIEQATHDALTSLYNRRFMDDALQRELARAGRENYPVCVMMLDIDHFKDFNDTYGHDAGDQVLVALGRLLRLSIRQSDIACRYGGEEFVIILPGANVDDGCNRAEILRHDFAELTVEFEGKQLSATITVGVALYPLHGASPDELLRAADSAMYGAKSAGRNIVRLARK
jgi:diguanylate cyclase (GGDEF)-like protein/PAS domain S-box-containing protein